MNHNNYSNNNKELPPFSINLSSEEAQERFTELQHKILPQWRFIKKRVPEDVTVVVLPSMTGMHLIPSYEERMLFMLFLLRQPLLKIIYISSVPINPDIIEYYLSFLPDVLPSQARERLFLISPMESSEESLTDKVLRRPGLIRKIRNLIPDPNRCHLAPYNSTFLERDLAIQLGIPMYAVDPKFLYFGTKSGCRTLFQEEGIPLPIGRENLKTEEDVIKAMSELRKQKPGICHLILKLNEGYTGRGNADIDLSALPSNANSQDLYNQLLKMKFAYSNETYQSFFLKFNSQGGILEELILGKDLATPSAQLRITPYGEVELLSTHDQILRKYTYLGSYFPANNEYAKMISNCAIKIGKRLAKEGVIGRLALDFVVVRNSQGSFDPYAIEINLRKGGTTNPFLTLQYLTDGTYDPETALFIMPNGKNKFYIAMDRVESPLYKSLTPTDLFNAAVKHGINFDRSRQTGVIFHMISALSEIGLIGLTAIENSPEEVKLLYQRTLNMLNEESANALMPLQPAA